MKNLMSNRALVPVLIVMLFLFAGAATWLAMELDAAKAEIRKWKSTAIDASGAYLKSHGGMIPAGTRIYSEDGGKTYLVAGFESPSK